jgi:hypothetical protein
MSVQNTSHTQGYTTGRRVSTETKSSYKTTELIAYVVIAIAILVASAVTDASDFGTQEAWFYITLLTIGYMVSRGLAKSGSRDFYDDTVGADHRNDDHR